MKTRYSQCHSHVDSLLHVLNAYLISESFGSSSKGLRKETHRYVDIVHHLYNCIMIIINGDTSSYNRNISIFSMLQNVQDAPSPVKIIIMVDKFPLKFSTLTSNHTTGCRRRFAICLCRFFSIMSELRN